MNAIVALSGVGKRFGEREVFENLDLHVAPGETLAILGRSGCGKSTLLRLVAGLATPDSGTVEVRGNVGFVFQEPRLMPWLDVERNVAFAARDAAERARVRDAIDSVGLGRAARVLPKALSGGMAQRAALARALVREPDVLLLDEPLSALDALLRIELQTQLANVIAGARATAILVTHDVDEALFLADRILVFAATPARVRVEVNVPPAMRRNRLAESGEEKRLLLSALGVEAAAAAPSSIAPPLRAV